MASTSQKVTSPSCCPPDDSRSELMSFMSYVFKRGVDHLCFQANRHDEVCTFKLVVKNASSLLDDKDPAKLEAEAILSDLVRSFTNLNDATNEADIQLVSNRHEVANAVMNVISSLDKFEQGVKNILEV